MRQEALQMTGPGNYTRQVWKSKEMRVKQYMAARKASNTSAADFARGIGVDKNMFYKWCRESGIKLKRGGDRL